MYAGLADLDPANSKKPIAHAGSKRKEPEALLDAVNPNDDEEGPGADVTETTAESVLDAVLPASDDAATADDTSDETTAVAPGKGGATAETETSTTEGDSLLESASEGIFGMLGGGDGEATTSVAPTKGDSTAEAKTAATEGTDNAADGEGTTPAPTTSETEATEAAAETPETETTEGEGLLGFIIPDVIDGGGGDETTTSMAPTKGDSTAEAETTATEGTDDPEGSDEATEEDDGASVNEDTRSGEGATKGDGIAPGIAARLKTVAAHVAEHSKQLSDIAVGKTVSKAAIVPVLGRLRNDIAELETIGEDTPQLDQTSKQVIFIPESKNMQRSFSPRHLSAGAIADHADKMAIAAVVLKQLAGEDHRARRIGTQRQLVALRKVESQLSKLY